MDTAHGHRTVQTASHWGVYNVEIVHQGDVGVRPKRDPLGLQILSGLRTVSGSDAMWLGGWGSDLNGMVRTTWPRESISTL